MGIAGLEIKGWSDELVDPAAGASRAKGKRLGSVEAYDTHGELRHELRIAKGSDGPNGPIFAKQVGD